MLTTTTCKKGGVLGARHFSEGRCSGSEASRKVTGCAPYDTYAMLCDAVLCNVLGQAVPWLVGAAAVGSTALDAQHLGWGDGYVRLLATALDAQHLAWRSIA